MTSHSEPLAVSDATALSKETVSLLDLKRAIESVPQYANLANDAQGLGVVKQRNFYRAREEAWRSAFRWRDKFGPIARLNDEQLAEFNAGMRLILEKLQP